MNSIVCTLLQLHRKVSGELTWPVMVGPRILGKDPIPGIISSLLPETFQEDVFAFNPKDSKNILLNYHAHG